MEGTTGRCSTQEPSPIRTERLVLRRITEDDIAWLYDLDTDAEVIRHTEAAFQGVASMGREEYRDREFPRYVRAYGNCGHLGFWAVSEAESGEPVGWIHALPVEGKPGRMSLGYRLLRSRWGRGYATEGARELVGRLEEVCDVTSVEASALTANAPSVGIMRKLGLVEHSRFIHHSGGEAVLYVSG